MRALFQLPDSNSRVSGVSGRTGGCGEGPGGPARCWVLREGQKRCDILALRVARPELFS